jgi:hypothetical protein
MKILPAWIASQTDAGIVCIPGSSPQPGSVDVFIPHEDIEQVAVDEQSPPVDGRRFGVIVIKPKESET